jgi:glycosyltransferase involved in cell wall biosynthesis
VIIALDATPLTVSTGGVARYTSELARALAERYPHDQFWLLSDQPFAPLPNPPENLHHGNPPRTPLSRKWWLWGLQQEMMRRRVDLFHGTDFSVPYLPLRAGVMTVSDLSPWLFPDWQPDANRIRLRTPLLLRAGLATMVITYSESVRRAVIERFGLRPTRVVAVPLAASPMFKPVDCEPGNYILFVGTLEPRKNIATLIEAWRELRKTHNHVDLCIAGRLRSDFKPIPPEPGLRLLGAVPDEDLPRLYSAAAAVVYPTFYEGFGLPVVEAMQCGAVVITSRDPAVTEVSGGAALHVDAKDAPGLVAALTTVLESPDRSAGMRQRAIARSREFSWRRTAEETREVYDAALAFFRKK